MATMVDWPITIGIVFLVWGTLILLEKTILKAMWPKWLRPIDLVVPVMWWSLDSITFQLTHYTVVMPLLLMFVLWGLALALYQIFKVQHFVRSQFWIMWWRIVALGSLLALVLIPMFLWLKLK